MTAVASKCRVCRGPAVIDLPRHNANFCAEHFLAVCRRQVERAVADHAMFTMDDRLLVAVSGGKDSLAVWDLLVDLGYRADGVYVGLGIGEYSATSRRHAEAFATARGLTLQVVDLPTDHGFDVPTASRATGRAPCSACGISKRHVFDAAALAGDYDALVTGHNLDDEAAVLFGNTLRWDVEAMARQSPVLPARPGFPRKVKPLVRLTERETAAWCLLRGIDYLIEECPMALGNRHLAHKESLNALETRSPGAKASFYLEFLARMGPLLQAERAVDLRTCTRCGAPTSAEVCAFCRVADTTRAHEPVPVEVLLGRGRRGGVSA